MDDIFNFKRIGSNNPLDLPSLTSIQHTEGICFVHDGITSVIVESTFRLLNIAFYLKIDIPNLALENIDYDTLVFRSIQRMEITSKKIR